MATIREKFGSRPFTYDGINSTYEKTWLLTGFSSSSAALSALALTNAVVTIDGVELANRKLSLTPRGRPSSGSYTGKAVYSHVSRKSPLDWPVNLGDEKLNFSFSMGSAFFTRAIEQETFSGNLAGGATGPVLPAKDVGLALNVLTDGAVEGIDVDIPGDGLQVSTRADLGGSSAAVNKWLKDTIDQLGTVNSEKFRSLEPGDAIFRAFSGSERGNREFDLTFDFGVKIGEDFTSSPLDTGEITFAIGRRVAGFEVVWIQYDQHENTEKRIIVPRARGAYVAKVFEETDFASLGVST